MSDNYDATWYDYSRDQVTRYGDHNHTINYNSGERLVYTTTTPESNRLMYEMIRKLSYPPDTKLHKKLPYPGGTPKSPSDKETTDMSTNGLNRDDLYAIDEAVREAIAAPKRAAEIAARKAAVEALGVEDKYEVGTVLTFDRESSKTVTHSHVALKTADGWYATGGRLTGNGVQSWDNLLHWMTTGENLVSNVAISTPETRTAITWTPAPADAPVEV